MKMKTQVQIHSKGYHRALATAKKLKELNDSLDLLNKDEIVLLGYTSSID